MELLKALAGGDGDRPDAVTVRTESLSWARLRSAAEGVAARIAGAPAVAVHADASLATVIGTVGGLLAGVPVVPDPPDAGPRERGHILTDSGAGVVIAAADLMEHVENTEAGQAAQRLTMDDLVPVATATDVTPVGEGEFDVIDTDAVQLLYTSGTTSAPKGAVMTHRSLMHEYLSCLDVLDFSAEDRQIHALPMYHSAQMHVFLLPSLLKGSYNIIVPAPVPAELIELFASERITSFFAAPTVWVALANTPAFIERDLSSLKRAYYGASIMPGPVLKKLRDHLPELGFYNCFGQSELGPLCTVLRPEEHDDHPGSAGRPVLFVDARVVDPMRQEVGPGEQGEIVYRSPQLMREYWNKPEATEEALRDGWFHSGDLVVADEQGFIEVVDRVKDVINTGGVLVASRQVEDAIFELDAVAEVAVVGMPDDKWIEAITAFVVPKGEITEEQVVDHVKGRLAPFKVPKAVHFVQELPKNTSGKILKRELRDR